MTTLSFTFTCFYILSHAFTCQLFPFTCFHMSVKVEGLMGGLMLVEAGRPEGVQPVLA